MTPTVPNRIYDVVKFVALVLLPAIGTLYFALAGIWHLPNAEQVVGTITTMDAFLGLLLGVSTNHYNNVGKYDGTIDVKENDGVKQFLLTVHGDPDELDKKAEVLFKINTK